MEVPRCFRANGSLFKALGTWYQLDARLKGFFIAVHDLEVRGGGRV